MIDDLDWIALTVKQEAEGELREGKLAVAFVIVNRMAQQNRSASQIVLAPFQFSCWNTDSPTKARLDPAMTTSVWRESYEAAALAYYHAVTDPTRGSTSYLNPAGCTPAQQKRAGYDPAKVRATIGHHHFFVAA